jgi:site-specific DNA-cytosine methylase
MEKDEIEYNIRPTFEEMRKVRIKENVDEKMLDEINKKMDRIIRMLTKIGYLIQETLVEVKNANK